MKKTGVINSSISAVIAQLGHTDTIVVADCGLPIPDQTQRIDISLRPGTPAFIDVLETILDEMKVERAIVASEITQHNPSIEAKVKSCMADTPLEYVPHEEFKQLTKQAKAVIRTGEATPYANIILVSGVTF
ncbi:D-ribose pyranase [Caldalkalibacillus uzonensis]|uniref:D-ribose pyranase n=1 Tax=Caldalkalibacillus uzonensis TaxID=353224 RepID=A0ABU0CQL8_9BACI|nr:D-ribose pyranase [Caldalkalibacillus uzonensis]MDQ0338713.1 D-ribose pyranase [Caldalkalibacillus uzonensis]